MSVIFHVFRKNEGNSRAIGRFFYEKHGKFKPFLSVISLVQRSLIIIGTRSPFKNNTLLMPNSGYLAVNISFNADTQSNTFSRRAE